jgi:hypothetical protein
VAGAITREIFRPHHDFVSVRPIRLSATEVLPAGEPIDKSRIRPFHLRSLYQRRRIGIVGSRWTESMLAARDDAHARPEVTGSKDEPAYLASITTPVLGHPVTTVQLVEEPYDEWMARHYEDLEVFENSLDPEDPAVGEYDGFAVASTPVGDDVVITEQLPDEIWESFVLRHRQAVIDAGLELPPQEALKPSDPPPPTPVAPTGDPGAEEPPQIEDPLDPSLEAVDPPEVTPGEEDPAPEPPTAPPEPPAAPAAPLPKVRVIEGVNGWRSIEVGGEEVTKVRGDEAVAQWLKENGYGPKS